MDSFEETFDDFVDGEIEIEEFKLEPEEVPDDFTPDQHCPAQDSFESKEEIIDISDSDHDETEAKKLVGDSSFSAETPPSTKDSRSRSKNRKKSKSKVTIEITDDAIVKCVFCSESFSGKQSLINHAAFCTTIRGLEPQMKCQKCFKELPASINFVYETRCKSNLPTALNPNHCQCPVCLIRVLHKDLHIHLANCLEHLKIATQLSREAGLDKSMNKFVATILFNVRVGNSAKVKEQLQTKNLGAKRKQPPTPSGQQQQTTLLKAVTVTPKNTRKPRETQHSRAGTTPSVQLKNRDQQIATTSPGQLSHQASLVKKQKLDQPPASVKGSADCPFCLQSFNDLDSLKEHPVRCAHMKCFEPKQKCRHCAILLPTSLTGLHQMVCSQNQDRIHTTRHNLKTVIFCPSCRVPKFVKHMPKHLAKCMKHLQSIMENALTNPTLSGNGPLDVDYIKTSGLDSWLKVPETQAKRVGK